jgi:aminocarboxymuconate-semialdehyde decarboxylase
LDVLWREASERRAIVLVHPFEPLPGTDLTDYGMVHLVGRPAESTIAAARLIFSGVLDRYRDIRFVIAHGGGFLPYQIGRLAKGYEARPENSPALHRSPALAFQSLFFDTVLSDRRSLKALVEIAGRDQVLLGSDYPFFIGDLEPARSLEAVEGLTDDDRRGIGGDNARRLMYDTIRRGRGTK